VNSCKCNLFDLRYLNANYHTHLNKENLTKRIHSLIFALKDVPMAMHSEIKEGFFCVDCSQCIPSQISKGEMQFSLFVPGYKDISQAWKEQIAMKNVEKAALKLYQDFFPLYRLLHGYVRYKLRLFYGRGAIRPKGHIPAHLLGELISSTITSFKY